MEVIIEEMHREQEYHGEQCFFTMNDGGNIKHPAWQERCGNRRVPHHHTADANDRHTPERGPVVEFFPVTEVIKHRALVQTKEPTEHCDGITKVIPVGYQGVGSEPIESSPVPANMVDKVDEVYEKYAHVSLCVIHCWLGDSFEYNDLILIEGHEEVHAALW